MADFCITCGNRMGATQRCFRCSAHPERGPEAILAKVTAKGRLRAAGFVIGASGVALMLSAFLPWVSGSGLVSGSSGGLTGGGVVLILIMGAALSFLAVRVLQDKTNKI